MAKFIEFERPYGTRHFINVDYIEEVVDRGNGKCVIYCGRDSTQDSFQIDMPYDEVVSMIKGALNNG